MKIYYPARWAGIVAGLSFLFLFFTFFAYAQQQSAYDAGVVRIKVSPALATQLESARITKGSGNEIVTGIKSLDNIHHRFQVSALKRVFRPAGKFEAKHRRYGLHLWYEVEMSKAASVLEALAAYKELPEIIRAEPVYKKAIVGSDNPAYGPVVIDSKNFATLPGGSNDPMLGSQWHYNNTGQTGGTPGSDISLFQAWGIETGQSTVIVAVTDGGIQVDHPDLAANMWVNTDEIPGNNIDDDNNGYVDDINGYGFGDNTGGIPADQHGTHVGGTIAAVTNNGIGVAGVAGGSGVGDGVRLMSCAAFGATNTGGFEDTYIYAADNGAIISQNSWGYTFAGVFDQVVLDAIDYFIAEAGKDELGNQVGPMNGGIVIFAAGNDDTNEEHYPGYYDATLAVSGVTHEDKKAWYSNFGPWVDIAAPGGETDIAQEGVLSTLSNNQYGFFQGTSMACPHVSGVAALIISKFGGAGFTPEMLRGRLVQTTDNIDAADPDFVGLLGSGRLNAFAALQQDDFAAPDAIADLSAAHVTITGVTLTWTSPADAGNGSATSYFVRYSTAPITNENFDSATLVANPPSPKPAGGAESFSIDGLAPGTLYYFAVKSADFFGNTSTLSNVLEQATNFAPVISVAPTSLTADLLTAQTTTQSFTISNTGQGPLEFTIVNISPPNESFSSIDSSADTLAPGGNAMITVTFDASNKGGGLYSDNLIILSNDPAQDSILFPLQLNVTPNGAPIASFSPDTINFGGVFEGGSAVRSITIHNDGSEPLAISQVTSSDGAFTTDFSGSLMVESFQDAVIHVTFSPTSVVSYDGFLSIVTNDPNTPSFPVAVSGQGLEAPGIEVIPAALAASLNTGKTSVQALTVQNTGASNLEFSVSVAAPAAASASVQSTSKQIQLPPSSAAKQSSAKQSSAGKYQQASRSVTIKSVAKSAATASVLILTPDSDVGDLAAIFNAFDDIDATVFPVSALPGITLADVTPYDIVVTSNNTQWLSTGGVDPEVMGDLLADYIDGGGKVIVNQFAYSYDAWQMTGRFIDDDYGPFEPSTTDANIDVSMGTILEPGHPVMLGVSSLDYSGYVQNVGLVDGAVALAEWSNGELFVAVNGNVVALNMLPSLGNGGALQWTGDLPTLYQNAVHYLSGPSYVKVSPDEAVVAPGEQVVLEVTFNAGNLDAGVYNATINIENNVPGKELVAVPAVLTVLGPEFTVTPGSLSEELEKQQTSVKTLVLRNNGPSDYTFTVGVQGSGLSVAPAKKSGAVEIAAAKTRTPRSESSLAMKSASERPSIERTNRAVVSPDRSNKILGRTATPAPMAAGNLYATDFESFATGDITGQDGWEGQYGNWTIENVNPFGGQRHFSGLADGLGLSLAFSPVVGPPTESTSSTTMKVNLQGSGVSWEVIPQSVSTGFVNTRLEFGADGIARVLTDDGAGGGIWVDVPASIPSGYFDLTIEVSTDSSTFGIYFNDSKVFSGKGFAAFIEQVVILSWMEEAGPTMDVDNFRILDGKVGPAAPPFISVTPVSGNLNSGDAVEIQVTFDAGDMAFGKYTSAVTIDIAGADKLVVPATLTVVGDPAIEVNPTVVQTVVDYREDTVRTINVKNTGGRPLAYSMQVIGANTDVAKLPPGPVNKYAMWENDARLFAKQELDSKKSKAVVAKKAAAIELLSGNALLQEEFESASFPPGGWSVVNNENNGVTWGFAADIGYGNFCGTGEAATVSSDAIGFAEFDTELITPFISTTGYKNIVVQYSANYQNFASLDFLDLDVQVAGSSEWTTVLSWNEDHGTLFGTPGEFVSVALDEFLNGATSFRLRWHYYDPNTDDYDWYAQIDNVVVLGDPRAWLSVAPASGVVPVGGTAAIEAKFDAADVEPGFYVAGILVTSNAPTNPLIGVVASMEVREPAAISVSPDSLYQVLERGTSAAQQITVSNSGESALKFTIGNVPIPTGNGAALERRVASTQRTERAHGLVNLLETKAIAPLAARSASTELYVTGFEEFAPGDINGQEGWEGQWGNWTVEGFNPFEGAQHFKGLSDGLGLSLAFSPGVAIGTDPVSSTTMKLNLDNAKGATWQVIPQSSTAELVNTRVEFAADGTLSALVQDSLGNVFYEPIPVVLPSGYFDFRIDVDRATAWFTLYVDNVPVFSGQGFAGDIEQVVMLSLMETFGPTFDLDNIVILDGPPQAPWLVLDADEGFVPSGRSTTFNAIFNAQDVEAGIYQQLITISSNDPLVPVVTIPVTLEVFENHPPVLVVHDTLVAETETISVVFTATDVDDSLVTVVLKNAPAFITPVSSGNGTASYSIHPTYGEAGEYDLTVVATDGRGKSDSATFHLTVIPYGVDDFSLIDITTGNAVLNFKDSITLDVLDPQFTKYRVRANTRPAEVGSVQFWVDGKKKNVSNNQPYLMDLPVLGSLSKGDHVLKAESFRRNNARGVKGKAGEALVTITNSSAVLSFEAVTRSGVKLFDLVDGAVIQLKDAWYIRTVTTENLTGSVQFHINGNRYSTDNTFPYSLAGDYRGTYAPWPAKVGHYTITATPFAKDYGIGITGTALTISFDIVDGTGAAPTVAQNFSDAAADEISVAVYPVPTQDQLTIQVSGKAERDVRLTIRTMQGQQLFLDNGTVEKFRNYSISTVKLGMSAGMYIVQVEGANGLRKIVKFVKTE